MLQGLCSAQAVCKDSVVTEVSFFRQKPLTINLSNMKPILNFFTLVLIIGIIILVSCKKEHSCEDCADKNKPPIAIAGPDQVITLPTESVLLDGSSSSDPDGIISEWLWTKISGPAFI